MYLIDTDILIDYLRLYEPALAFLEQLKRRERHIAFISQFELLQGCTKKEQEAKLNRFVKQFITLPLDGKTANTALQLYRTKHWHLAMSIPDSFIAATALVKKLTLMSRNTKHYEKIEGLDLKRPYE